MAQAAATNAKDANGKLPNGGKVPPANGTDGSSASSVDPKGEAASSSQNGREGSDEKLPVLSVVVGQRCFFFTWCSREKKVPLPLVFFVKKTCWRLRGWRFRTFCLVWGFIVWLSIGYRNPGKKKDESNWLLEGNRPRFWKSF